MGTPLTPRAARSDHDIEDELPPHERDVVLSARRANVVEAAKNLADHAAAMAYGRHRHQPDACSSSLEAPHAHVRPDPSPADR